MIFENKKFRDDITDFLDLTRALFMVNTDSKSVYSLDNTIEDYGIICRLWNNTTDYELSLAHIDRIVVSERLKTAVLFVKPQEIVFGAIPLGIHSLSGMQAFAGYGGTDYMAFCRICDILLSISKNVLINDIDNQLSYVITALTIRAVAPESKEFAKISSVRNIVGKLNRAIGIDEKEDFTHIRLILDKLRYQSFMEIVNELVYENSIMQYCEDPQDDDSEDEESEESKEEVTT